MKSCSCKSVVHTFCHSGVYKLCVWYLISRMPLENFHIHFFHKFVEVRSGNHILHYTLDNDDLYPQPHIYK